MVTISLNNNQNNKTVVINDPLGQTHSLASKEIFFSLDICFVSKSGDGRTDGHIYLVTTINFPIYLFLCNEIFS